VQERCRRAGNGVRCFSITLKNQLSASVDERLLAAAGPFADSSNCRGARKPLSPSKLAVQMLTAHARYRTSIIILATHMEHRVAAIQIQGQTKDNISSLRSAEMRVCGRNRHTMADTLCDWQILTEAARPRVFPTSVGTRLDKEPLNFLRIHECQGSAP